MEKIDNSKITHKVLKRDGTEAPHTGQYNNHFEEGIYVEKESKEFLFSSHDKFKSNCGWPSFSNSENTVKKEDYSLGMIRTEVRSKKGDNHLGHVFNDGPKNSGGIRYCINSAALEFIPKAEMEKRGYAKYLKLFKKS